MAVSRKMGVRGPGYWRCALGQVTHSFWPFSLLCEKTGWTRPGVLRATGPHWSLRERCRKAVWAGTWAYHPHCYHRRATCMQFRSWEAQKFLFENRALLGGEKCLKEPMWVVVALWEDPCACDSSLGAHAPLVRLPVPISPGLSNLLGMVSPPLDFTEHSQSSCLSRRERLASLVVLTPQMTGLQMAENHGTLWSPVLTSFMFISQLREVTWARSSSKLVFLPPSQAAFFLIPGLEPAPQGDLAVPSQVPTVQTLSHVVSMPQNCLPRRTWLP